jgi:hypothetical protein
VFAVLPTFHVVIMQAVIRAQQPVFDRCKECGKQPRFVTSILDPLTGRTFQMIKCQCGEKTWIVSPDAVHRPGPASVRQDRR